MQKLSGLFLFAVLISGTFSSGLAFAQDPIANDDSITILENTPIIIPVLANDVDVDGDLLTIISVIQPFSGSVLILSSSTQVEYTPNNNFVGNDTFSYVVSDGQGGNDTATVTVNVEPNNDTIIEQLLAQIQDLLDKILNLENEITTLQEENTALALRNAELEDIIANGTSTNDDSNDKVILCHKGKNTLSVSQNAVSAHLKHGDEIGKCDDTEISPKKVIKNEIKELKFEYKIAAKELKNDFKEQEKDLKKQYKDLKKDKKSEDKNHDEDDED
ncbi:MAG: cadherin-like domain-containing protein [Nitrosopumilus sp.]|uniref:Ig-like domain-containing protein n=1 Tax=Nitrosopumilus sp. TaxID=2024843 RepID=UPI00247D49A8|nr:Ig-like domain-containing protein [Nitrosopumilus sp.]MCV0392968.1 cadherin-like domain-containing protein [Nitrosopumilus sp.]